MKKYHTLKTALIALDKKALKENLTLKVIIDYLSGKGENILIVILSLPFCFPIHVPGISLVFGLIIALIAICFTFDKKMWFPKKLLDKKIKRSTVKEWSTHALALIQKAKSLTKPRLIKLTKPSEAKITHGIVIFFLGILLALPLPIPATNITAAWSIFLISFGLLESDGLFIILGYVATLFTTAFFILIAFTAIKIF